MSYNSDGKSGSTLTLDERSRQGQRLLELLAEVDSQDLERALTQKAIGFLHDLWLQKSLLVEGQRLSLSESQYWWLQDLWSKFA